MFYDSRTILATDFDIALNADAVPTNAPTAISDVVDLSVVRDAGAGKPVYLRIECTEAPVASVIGDTPIEGVTCVVATEVFTSVAHGLSQGTPVELSAIVDLADVDVGITYYVCVINADTFKLASTLALALANAPDVDVTGSDGSCTVTTSVSPVNEFQFMVVTSDAAALTSGKVLCQSPPWGCTYHDAGAYPAVGDVFYIAIPPSISELPARYLGIMYRNPAMTWVTYAPSFTNAMFSAGKFTLAIVVDHPELRSYRVGYTA